MAIPDQYKNTISLSVVASYHLLFSTTANVYIVQIFGGMCVCLVAAASPGPSQDEQSLWLGGAAQHTCAHTNQRTAC